MMNPMSPSPLPFFDRNLLRVVEKIVPSAEREEWSRTWHAELWHMHYRRRRTSHLRITVDLSVGLICDALWLRTDSWSRALSGTPALCLATLLGLCVLSTFLGLAITGSWHALGVYLDGPFIRSAFAALLVVFVSFATASRGHIEQTSTSKGLHGVKRQIFFAAKALLVMLLTFLLSANVCRPIHASFPNPAGLFQILFFVLMTLVALRWAFRDQEERCKQCLRSLATPARVGRPSHNLLEWNGTEMVCKQGHGLLSVPEMETSWCQSSQWVDLNSVWE